MGIRLRRRAYMKDREFGEEVEKVFSALNEYIDEYMIDNRINSWKLASLPVSEKEFNECVKLSINAFVIIMKHYHLIFNDFKYKGKFIIQPLITEEKEEMNVENKIDEN